MSTTVTLDLRDRIARVRFVSDNGIHLLSASVRQELAAALDGLEAKKGVSVVVFESEGRTFLAGADINELRSLSRETAEDWARTVQALMTRIARLPATTIAAIHAACAGGGTELALACDLRLAAESARIGLPETSLGLIPGWGGTVRATRILGPAVARRLILTGELIAAREALRLGLVDAVAPEAGFRAVVDERIEQILTRGLQARAAAKSLIAALEGSDIGIQLQAEARAFAECYSTNEPNEGMRAFLTKRAADWASADANESQ